LVAGAGLLVAVLLALRRAGGLVAAGPNQHPTGLVVQELLGKGMRAGLMLVALEVGQGAGALAQRAQM
jgi:hypothetical protein